MHRFILSVVLAIFLFAHSAQAQSFNLKSISEDLREAVLVDKDTGAEWAVGEGDEVEGWSIVKIKKNCVVIRKEIEGEEHQAIVRTLTLPKKLGVMPVPR